MPLRVLLFAVPEKDEEAVAALLAEAGPWAAWRSREGGEVLYHVFLEAGQVEPVSDALQNRFGKALRLAVLPVEAVVPPPEEAKPPEEKPSPERVGREELYQELSEASEAGGVYLALVALATLVAAVGLVKGSAALVIGAMVIAPLLGPAMALALGSALGDLDLFRKAFRTLLLGVALASGLSLALGFFLPVDPSAPELAPRTRPGLEDVAVALAAGVAGALGFTTWAPAALVGVMVAVALLPPLTAAGLLSGAGYPEKAFGAVLLFAVNVASVNLAGVATFLLQRVRPRTFWEAERAARASRTALLLWGLSLALLAGLLYLAQRVLPGF